MSRVAILLHCDDFRGWYEKVLGFNKSRYLESYRNDFSWNYAIGLRRQGIESIIYIVSLDYSGLHKTHDGFQVRFIPLKLWHKLITSRTPFFKRTAVGTFLQEVTVSLACFDAIKSALEEDNISLLCIQEYWTARFDFLVSNLQIPVIGADQGGSSERAIKAVKLRTLPKAYKLICQTLTELGEVERYGGAAVYLPNGVDSNFYYPASIEDAEPDRSSDRQKLILTVARLTNHQKRVSDLICALTHLDASWKLEVAGTGPDLQSLQGLAVELNVAERVRFLGFCADKTQLRTRYQQCSVFALPSAWEGLPLALLEAMSCGAAVVTTDIRAFEAMVFDQVNGIRVPVGKPAALAQAILKCDKNRDAYGKESRRIVLDCFSEEKTFAQLAKIIKKNLTS